MTAGLGTRLRPFTEVIPKPFIPVMGIPVVQYLFDLFGEQGIRNVVANVHHQPKVAQAALQSLDRSGVQFQISEESNAILGSAGGIRKALPLFGRGDALIVVNGDMVCDLSLKELSRIHLENQARGITLTLALRDKRNTDHSYTEVLVDEDQKKITGLGKKSLEGFYFTGVSAISTHLLQTLPLDQDKDFVKDLLIPEMKEGRVGYMVSSGMWFDVGTPKEWMETHFSIMEALDSPGYFPKPWMKRILEKNQRLDEMQWGLKQSNASNIEMTGKVYFAGRGTPPKEMGPNVVLYGTNNQKALKNGIGFGGHWVEVPAKE